MLRQLGRLHIPAALLISSVSGTLQGDGFYIANDVDWRGLKNHDILENVMGISEEGDIDSMIINFDDFSEDRKLGMHLGAEKGDIIEATVADALARHGNASRPFAVLEVGAHFGDGTMRVVRALQKNPPPSSAETGHSRIAISFESKRGWASGCRSLVEHALASKRQDIAKVHHQAMVVKPGSVVKAASAVLEHFKLPHFNVVLLDHDHKSYLKDLEGLVSAGALGAGSVVHADNAGRDAAILGRYLGYVEGEGPFTTRYETIQSPYPDRVAISQYTPRGAEL
mmetsp:Transcript_105746/g.315866  ORF Transcript_105746/g.315866 Transcript_105746/m.315866 type:complete len:283 (+) Transcript_105746:83-931(+)